MSGLAVEVARVAVGRLALSIRTFCIWRLTIMNEASRKNMMSISGIISNRVRVLRSGERSFIERLGGLCQPPRKPLSEPPRHGPLHTHRPSLHAWSRDHR